MYEALCNQCFQPLGNCIVYDHGLRFHSDCYAKHCLEKMVERAPRRENVRPFAPCLTLRISLRRFAGWWATTKRNIHWREIFFWVLLFTFVYCWPTEG